MPPETRLFLLITPPRTPFGPIEASCTIVGTSSRMFGTGAQFSSVQDLETRLATAGLPDFEIDRAILRLEVNHPTFSEISHAVADSLRLIHTSGDVSNNMQQETFDTARLLPFGSGVNATSAVVPA